MSLSWNDFELKRSLASFAKGDTNLCWSMKANTIVWMSYSFISTGSSVLQLSRFESCRSYRSSASKSRVTWRVTTTRVHCSSEQFYSSHLQNSNVDSFAVPCGNHLCLDAIYLTHNLDPMRKCEVIFFELASFNHWLRPYIERKCPVESRRKILGIFFKSLILKNIICKLFRCQIINIDWLNPRDNNLRERSLKFILFRAAILTDLMIIVNFKIMKSQVVSIAN